jgi:anaerobic selenocysteine-containing dehydrogenase
MSAITEALLEQRVKVMLLFGTNMLASFADANRLAEGLERTDLVVCHDLFMQDTARRCADIILPATAWLEQLGCKMSNTHLYLMDQVLEPPGEVRTMSWILRQLAQRLDVAGFFPWPGDEQMIDAILDHPCTGHATLADLRAEGGIRALNISHIGHPQQRYPTPSGRIEFYSERALQLGLPALPVYQEPAASTYPLIFRQGRTLTHFHGFYDQGRALPSLARLDHTPQLWIAPADAAARAIDNGAPIRLYNERGEFEASALVTDKVPAGTVWMRSGWAGVNRLTSGKNCIPDAAVDVFHFAAGQAAFDARIEVEAL